MHPLLKEKRSARKERASLLVAVFFLFLVSILVKPKSTYAEGDQPLSAEVVQVSTPVYHPNLSEFRPPLGTYLYSVSWQGIPAADVKVSVNQDGSVYKVIATAKTYSAIDLIYKLRFKAEGLISAIDLLPIKTVINQKENSRIKNTELTFLDSGEIRAVREQNGKDTKVLQFNPRNFTLDPFSAAFLARSLDWETGETKYFDTFNGKSRYLISLTAEDKVSLTVNGKERDVWIISPRVKNLTSGDTAKKLRAAKIYLTADSEREILQIVSSVFIGSVKTRLTSFVPTPSDLDTKIAQTGGTVYFK